MKNQKMCESIWPTWQVLEIKQENKKKEKRDVPNTPETQPETRYTIPEEKKRPKSQLCAIQSRRCPGKPGNESKTENGSPREL